MNEPKNKTVDTSKLVGPAIIALRANIKALEDGSTHKKGEERFRYEIAADRSEARIVDTTITAAAKEQADKWANSSDNQVVPGSQKPLAEYATSGRPLRLCKIGLLDRKLALEESAKRAGETAYIRYSYNATTGAAGLTRNGNPITELPAPTKENPNATIAAPTTVEGWAKLGREVEKGLFECLKMAQDYGSQDGVNETRAKMIARGVIRERREEKK